MKKKSTFSDYLIWRIYKDKIDTIFSLTGGGIMYLIDSIYRSKVILHCNNHEEFSGLAADGYARSRKKQYGVAIGTTGPGVANLIPAISSSWVDNTPVLYIGGQVKSIDSLALNKFNLRQHGTFEFDGYNLISNITKYSKLIDNVEDGFLDIEKALFYMLNNKTGPSYLEIPLDIQGKVINENFDKILLKTRKKLIISKKRQYKNLNSLNLFPGDFKFKKFKKPLFLLGAGLVRSDTYKLFTEKLIQFKIPYIVTQFAREIGSLEDKYFIGSPGIKANRSANIALSECDLLISVGTSLHQQITGWDQNEFAKNAYKIWYDIDKNNYTSRGKKLSINKFFNLDCARTLNYLSKNKIFNKISSEIEKKWHSRITLLKSKFHYHFPTDEKKENGICYYKIIKALSDNLKLYSCVCTDAGLAWYIVPQHFDFKRKVPFISSGGFGSMGMALPYAIGASRAIKNKKKFVLCITGDGSIMTSISELGSLKDNFIKVILVIINNGGYRSIRATHDKFFDSRLIGTSSKDGLKIPNFKKLCNSYGIKHINVNSLDKLLNTLKNAENYKSSLVLEIKSKYHQKVEPVVLSKLDKKGNFISTPSSNMFPYVKF